MTNSEPRIGDVVAGCRIQRILGEGGMGVVYLAHQVHLDRRVALKLMRPHLGDDDDFRERFQREARAAAAIDHEHMVPIYDFGDESGLLYLIMRYVEGRNLLKVIDAEWPLDPARATTLVAQVAAALDAAHAQSFVHRDVKPANVLVECGSGTGDRAYLVDFGLAKRLWGASLENLTAPPENLTAPGQFVGTIDYVAPEQILGADVKARTDVYALGCVLYHALTKSVPFPRANDTATLLAHVHDIAPPPSQLRDGLPPLLDDVIRRAMAKDPKDRYPSAGDLGRAALAAARGERAREPERSVATGPAASRPAETLPTSRRRVMAAWVAAGVIVVLLAAVVALVRTSGSGVRRVTVAASTKPTATVTSTSTVTTSASSPPGGPSGTPGPPASQPVYWHGTVGITSDGINFDIRPPTTSSDAPTNIAYTGTGLENAWTDTSIVVSWWNQSGKPSQSQCQNWVATHRNTLVDPVSPGMQICIKTGLGRYGRLTIDSGANNGQLQATATIWGS